MACLALRRWNARLRCLPIKRWSPLAGITAEQSINAAFGAETLPAYHTRKDEAMKIPLQRRSKLYRQQVGGIEWHSCSPFIDNSRALLVHRPRYGATLQIRAKYKPHFAIEFWCGSSSTGTKKFTFLDEPTQGKFLCARCEEKAIAAGYPSSTDLTGKHIHTGGTIAVQKCCIEPTKETK